jgi:hypothetical protein
MLAGQHLGRCAVVRDLVDGENAGNGRVKSRFSVLPCVKPAASSRCVILPAASSEVLLVAPG